MWTGILRTYTELTAGGRRHPPATPALARGRHALRDVRLAPARFRRQHVRLRDRSRPSRGHQFSFRHAGLRLRLGRPRAGRLQRRHAHRQGQRPAPGVPQNPSRALRRICALTATISRCSRGSSATRCRGISRAGRNRGCSSRRTRRSRSRR